MKIKLYSLLLSLCTLMAHASIEEIRTLVDAVQSGTATRAQVNAFLNNTIRNPNNRAAYSVGTAELINLLLNFVRSNQNQAGQNTPENITT